jgi:hypothetical protein
MFVTGRRPKNSSQLRKLPVTFEAWMMDRHSRHEPHAVGAVDIARRRPRPRHSLARLLVASPCIFSSLDAGSRREIFSVLPSLPTRLSSWRPVTKARIRRLQSRRPPCSAYRSRHIARAVHGDVLGAIWSSVTSH